MLCVFSCAFWFSVCFYWRNVFLNILLIFFIGLVVFLRLSFMSCVYILEINPLSVALFANFFFHSGGCLFVYGFLFCTKAFKFNQVPFCCCCCFYFHYSRRWIQKEIVAIYVREFCYVFLRILQYLVFHRGLQSILSLFMHMVLGSVIIHSFTYSCPVFPAPLIEDTIFSILYSCLLCYRLGAPMSVGLSLWV